jgi:hypothetical protein
MTTATGGPAFPSKKRIQRAGYATQEFEPVDGMTLRDYAAIKAMQSLITHFLNTELNEVDPQGWMDGLAMDSYSMADAMLKASKK